MACFTTPYSVTLHLLYIFRNSTTVMRTQSLVYEHLDEDAISKHYLLSHYIYMPSVCCIRIVWWASNGYTC